MGSAIAEHQTACSRQRHRQGRTVASGITQKDRVIIQAVSPQVDGGRYAAKAVVGEDVVVGADIFREGHDKLAAVIRYRGPEDRGWREAPLALDVNDRWYGVVPRRRERAVALHDLRVDRPLRVVARRPAARSTPPGRPTSTSSSPTASRCCSAARSRRATAEVLDRGWHACAATPRTRRRWRRPPTRTCSRCSTASPSGSTPRRTSPSCPVGGPRARPVLRLVRDVPPLGGRDRDDERHVRRCGQAHPRIAEMGFDVLYLPPIHPIGTTNRKGRTGPHDLDPGPDDPGVPWAIGSAEGGHTAIHPDLGTFDDFDEFVRTARTTGSRSRSTSPSSARPTTRGSSEHPEWFRTAPTGRSPTRRTRRRSTRTSTRSTSTPPTPRGCGELRPSSSSGWTTASASSASTTRTRRRCRSGSGSSPRSARTIPRRSSSPRRSPARR
jgi:starch synthase (maltosyl-transferring)